jgi:hypothetical protein
MNNLTLSTISLSHAVKPTWFGRGYAQEDNSGVAGF